MSKKIFLNFISIYFFLLVPTCAISKIIRYKYFAESLRIDGGSGKIYSFNSYTLEQKKISLGLHRFDFVINYGATVNSEIGLKFNLYDLQDLSKISHNLNKISPYIKYHIIDSSYDNPFDLSLGIYRNCGFLVIEKLFPKFYSTSFVTNLFFSFFEQQKFFYTFAFSKYTKWVEIVVDSNIINEKYSIGARCLLTPEIKLDLFILDIKNLSNILFNNFIFGITIKS